MSRHVRILPLIAIGVGLVLSTSGGHAQTQSPQAVFRTNIDVVTIPVFVKGSSDVLSRLSDKDFALTDNGVRQQVELIDSESLPVDVTLLMETGAAIENVVRNALHHAPRDSSVEVQLVADADRYRLFVRDTGPGVPAHELERIFEPFHRVAPDRARESGGAGLGLAITARVMNAQGGGCQSRNLARGLEISLWWPPA
jgi:signal transduction histidine kinase